MKKKMNLFLCGLALVLSGLLMPAQSDTAAAGPEGTAQKKAKCPSKVSVLLETVKPMTFSEYRYLSGQAQPEVIAVVSPVAGIVSELKVGEGSLVEAGQELAVLNAGLDEKTKALEQETAKKKKILADRQNWKVKNEKAIQNAERDYQAALALLEGNTALANRSIQAPLAGILRLKTTAGAEVAQDALLFEIVDPLHLRVEAALGAGAAGFFNQGEKLMAAAEGVGGVMEAEIVAVSESKVSFRVDNSAHQLLEGMIISCKKLRAEHAEAIVIPTSAVQQDGLGDFIYTAEKKKAKKLYVTIGVSEAGKTTIEKGLAAGAQIIVSGFECLADKKKIRVVNEEQLAKEKAESLARQNEEKAKAEKIAEAQLRGIDEFIAHLIANRETLQYDRYEKTEIKKLPVLKVFSGLETQKKLLDLITQYDVKQIDFELKDKLVVSTITFKTPGKVAGKEEKPAVGEKISLFGERLRFAVHGTYYMMLDKNFKAAYVGLSGFGGSLAFRFAPKMDFWVSGGMAAKNNTPAWSPDEMKFRLIPLSADLRYYFMEKGKLSAFAGIGANVFMVKDVNPAGDIKTTMIGFNALGGGYYKLSKKLFAQLYLKFNMVKKDLYPDSTLDDPLNLSGLELNLGVGILL
jgi:membrane fusion protein (multidrug efflux system)